MASKKTVAGPRYVKTIEFVDRLPAEESLFQEGEYQRLTESGKIENLRVKIELYPDELTLVDEIGNDNIRMKLWLDPGQKRFVATVTRRITLKILFVLKAEKGESVIGVTGDTHVINRIAERVWVYDKNDTFIGTNIDATKSPIDFDDALLPKLWSTTDDQEAVQKLEEVRGLLESGKVKFE